MTIFRHSTKPDERQTTNMETSHGEPYKTMQQLGATACQEISPEAPRYTVKGESADSEQTVEVVISEELFKGLKGIGSRRSVDHLQKQIDAHKELLKILYDYEEKVGEEKRGAVINLQSQTLGEIRRLTDELTECKHGGARFTVGFGAYLRNSLRS